MLTHAKVDVTWLDNDTGSYDVTNRVSYTYLPPSADPRFCKDGECKDEILVDKVDGWLEQAAGYVVSNYRAEITTLITDTVERWDAEETSRKIELQVGRDLQFIRINGTVVGALAGLVIYTVANVLF